MRVPRIFFVVCVGLLACFLLHTTLSGSASGPVPVHGHSESSDNQPRRLQAAGPILFSSTTDVSFEWFSDSTCTTPSNFHGSHKIIFRKEQGSKCLLWEYFRLGEQGSGFHYVKLDNGVLKMYLTPGCKGNPIYSFDPSWLRAVQCPRNKCVEDGGLYKTDIGRGFDPDSDGLPTCTETSTTTTTMTQTTVFSGGFGLFGIMSADPHGEWLDLTGSDPQQSSTSCDGPAWRAIDGNSNGHYWKSRSCTHTQSEIGSWWKVDLGMTHTVLSVSVTNRADCCWNRLSDFEILVGEYTCGTHLSVAAGQTKVFDCMTWPSGSEVKVQQQLEENTPLTLCEVGVKVVQNSGHQFRRLSAGSGHQFRRLFAGPLLGVSTVDVTFDWFSDSTCTTPLTRFGGIHKYNFRRELGSNCFFWEYFKLGQHGSGFKFVRLEENNILRLYTLAGCKGSPMMSFDPSWAELLRCPPNTCDRDCSFSHMFGGECFYRTVSGEGFNPDSDVPPTCVTTSTTTTIVTVTAATAIMAASTQVEWLDLAGSVARQSSTANGGPAWKAIDGNSNNIWSSGSCTHTQSELGWWKVDLGGTHTVLSVSVTNRGDCCGDRLSDFAILVGSNSCGRHLFLAEGQTKEFDCMAGLSGSAVEVTQLKRTYLSLCEVGVKVLKGTGAARLLAAHSSCASG